MPSTIPYNPSLTLTNIVNPDMLNNIIAIAELQAPVDAAQDGLNNLLAARRSLDMTIDELISMGIDKEEMGDITQQKEILTRALNKAATSYMQMKIQAETAKIPLRSKLSAVNATAESPVDYVKTQIKTMPLAADSLNLDVQYFSCDQEDQKSGAHAAKIGSYVSAQTAFLGDSFSAQASSAASSQSSRQSSSHSLVGTLVISVACTHKNATVLAPCVINVDKAIKIWNDLPGTKKLDPTMESDMSQAIKEEDVVADPKTGELPPGTEFKIISGTSYGSSFIGMVHILDTTDTTASERLATFAASVQAQMSVGAWFESASGGFGVDSSFSDDVKNLLSTQTITSHVTLITMGVIPSIVANDVQLAVDKFAKFDPQSSMEQIAAIQNSNASDQDTIGNSAQAARLGNQMINMKAAQVKATLQALDQTMDGKNKILDINSMMTALDDYLKKAREDTCGVPINYYLKSITRKMLAEMWVAKYLPGKYNTITYEDGAESKGAKSGGSGGDGGEGGDEEAGNNDEDNNNNDDNAGGNDDNNSDAGNGDGGDNGGDDDNNAN